MTDRPAPPSATNTRWIAGIDLGTTNSALAIVDLAATPLRVRSVDVRQLTAPGDVGARPTLPSFLYLPGEHELPPGATALPWDPTATDLVGELARSQGALVPSRLIASAKSWLIHPDVDREAPILPWAASPEVTRRSPVDASAAYLRHIAASFRLETGVALADVELVVTVPASFDEVARELTVEAARRAGLLRLTLLEEPLAAFYSLLARAEESRTPLPLGTAPHFASEGETILVCDIGGGTTDFSLLRCLPAQPGDPGAFSLAGATPLRFERTAVGDHLLLGGDNMDLALARRVEKRAAPDDKADRLDAARFQALVQACRTAKEKLLGGGAPRDRWTLHVAGRGRSLIGGGIAVELSRADVEETVLDGFFPSVARDAEPQRGLGLREFGLPYAPDAAVTRHLAAFLRRHGALGATSTGATSPGGGRGPDAILFNGGVLASRAIRERLVSVVASWTGRAPRVLENDAPDLAVARGAAYFALARRGQGTRIHAGAARGYYVEIEAPTVEGDTDVARDAVTVLCLAARGEADSQSGEPTEITGKEFAALTNQPVRFKLYSSSERDDRAGDVLTLPQGALAPLPSIVTVLRFPRSSQDVALQVRLQVLRTEIGTLDIHLHAPSTNSRFKLAFDLRAGEQQPAAASPGDEPATVAPVDEARIAAAVDVVQAVFDKAHPRPIAPTQAMKELSSALGLDKGQWPIPALRALWEPLKNLRGQRGRTIEHEARWLNLVGWCLRPGYGYPLDDWRVKEAWRLFNTGIVNDKDPRCRLEWWILWRRTSGGLTRTMQDELHKRIFPHFLVDAKKKSERKPPSPQEAAEMWRVAGSLERVVAMDKWKLGEAALAQIEKALLKKDPKDGRDGKDAARTGKTDGARRELPEPMIWSLGRFGARVPLYGPVENVISRQRAEKWLERLLALDWTGDSSRLGHNPLAFAAAEIARASGDRVRDVDEPMRQRIAARLQTLDANAAGMARLARLVLEPTALEDAEERFAFGDALPVGLRLTSTEGRAGSDAEPDAGTEAAT